MKQTTLERILRCRIVAVLRGVKGERLIPMGEAFRMGNMDCVELAFDPSGTQSARDTAAQISLLTTHFADRLCVGAGTVTTAEQVKLAASAGAGYIVSPGTIPEVIEAAKAYDLVCIPGAMTPTEILTASKLGGDMVKLFPASFVGTEYLDALLPVLGNIPLLASGGVNVWNLRAFLDAGCAAVAIGGKLTGELYKPDCDFGVLAETAKAYRAIADNTRKAL